MFTEYRLINIDLQLFAELNTQVTTSDGLTDGMKTYYSDYLIDLVEAELVHDQFAQKHPIPQHGGKIIEFRQWDTLPEMTEPITEGVTPDGQSLSMSTIEATVEQYGGYVTVSDMLELTHIDPVVVQATKAIASQAGRSLDTITREVLNAGTVVQYAEGQVDSRAKLAYTSKTDNHNLTVAAIKKAVRFLENQNAPKINGYYVGILHPFTKYDLMNDPEWQKPHQYCDTENIYANEIGEIAGVRFVQSTRAKKFEGAGASGADVYATLILADDAYGVTEITGGGLEHIVKQRGSAGTADPLNQRSTIGWKATKVAELLVPQYVVRIETTATP
ncbi:MAG: N4-gp56 family major capsid protein [Oscillospiraceae bacterium]|nr:N4-gp56 family major capsid protein [Oscillospiraceae bacterium]